MQHDLIHDPRLILINSSFFLSLKSFFKSIENLRYSLDVGIVTHHTNSPNLPSCRA